MSNLIDKEKVIELLTDDMENWHAIIIKTSFEVCIEEISKMPPVDAVPVVRCEKCRYWHRYSSSSRKGRCNGLILYLNGELETPEDFFCKGGKER